MHVGAMTDPFEFGMPQRAAEWAPYALLHPLSISQENFLRRGVGGVGGDYYCTIMMDLSLSPRSLAHELCTILAGREGTVIDLYTPKHAVKTVSCQPARGRKGM